MTVSVVFLCALSVGRRLGPCGRFIILQTLTALGIGRVPKAVHSAGDSQDDCSQELVAANALPCLPPHQ